MSQRNNEVAIYKENLKPIDFVRQGAAIQFFRQLSKEEKLEYHKNLHCCLNCPLVYMVAVDDTSIVHDSYCFDNHMRLIDNVTDRPEWCWLNRYDPEYMKESMKRTKEMFRALWEDETEEERLRQENKCRERFSWWDKYEED